MTESALSRRELDAAKCGTPGCNCPGPLILSPRCHMGKAVSVSYDWTTGLLTLRCSRCQQLITRIAVADTVRQDGR